MAHCYVCYLEYSIKVAPIPSSFYSKYLLIKTERSIYNLMTSFNTDLGLLIETESLYII